MKTRKKVIKAYDARNKDYQATVTRLSNKKHGSKGYHKPGSQNPRKNGA